MKNLYIPKVAQSSLRVVLEMIRHIFADSLMSNSGLSFNSVPYAIQFKKVESEDVKRPFAVVVRLRMQDGVRVDVYCDGAEAGKEFPKWMEFRVLHTGGVTLSLKICPFSMRPKYPPAYLNGEEVSQYEAPKLFHEKLCAGL